jgi:DNA-binding LacI/PurR family transcriptional regulator
MNDTPGSGPLSVRPHAPARMIDVARLAGVSQQTVSRVVNGHSNVAPEVRERVDQAIAQLRYRRNAAARSLATKRSMNLGVVAYGLAKHGPSVALTAIVEAARSHGYATSLVSLPTADRAGIRSAIDHLVDDSVDGIILLAAVEPAVETAAGLDAGVPLVIFAPNVIAPDTFGADEALGARLATQHLLDLGHRTVVHLSGPSDWLATQARIQGWWSALTSANRPVPEPIPTTWDAPSGYEAATRVLQLGGVTAVFAANDQTALGLMRGLGDAGVRVPDDISVVGFDDFPEAAYFSPPLTTVRVDFAEVGRSAVERLLDRLGDRQPESTGPLEPRLVLRSSTAPPPNAAGDS